MDPVALVLVIAALVVGVGLGWFLGSRGVGEARAEAQRREDDFKAAISDLAMAEERASPVPALREELAAIRDERDIARLQLTELRVKAEAFEARHAELRETKEAMAAQFGDLAGTALDKAQEKFLERAAARFKESEALAGANLKSMLQPVSERLQRYEEGVAKVEAERRDAFGELKGQIEQMRIGTERVSTEAAKLVNSLRNAPKSRGRWGEQQLKNVLETCGLSEHTDFETEVNVAGEDGGRLRPDAIVRVPGGRALVIDAKVSLNAYQDAFGAVDDIERFAGLKAHADSMRAHINSLGNKAYWSQFEDAPDYVIMFVPGEHFLSAALEHDPTLWDFAFDKRVLLATPTNLIAIARTVSAVWRQEKLAKEARQIGELGKELYDRLAKALGDLRVVGSGLNTAVKNFNTFANSLETRALVSARKLRDLNIEPGAREIESIPPVELLASHAGEAEVPELEAPAQAAE
ncbi:DNA recombination protein RmuC [Sphingomonas sp. JC676]|uniref:DNA recombination protein RmuC n=1 Tax=Sphingomonas sp. JC676 TaxID=2768065 RepID=UPI001657E27C|nr:DNA recombination protein RmuC [Sphingomonas sp. JC676]MBC9031474.1 DNA recombination protein RmuC [Sphingomonas sp. JC676]